MYLKRFVPGTVCTVLFNFIQKRSNGFTQWFINVYKMVQYIHVPSVLVKRSIGGTKWFINVYKMVQYNHVPLVLVKPSNNLQKWFINV
jgi:hypothetical protein